MVESCKKRILVRLDADNRIGMGHAIRVAGLLELLQTPYELTVIGHGEPLETMFPSANLISTGQESLKRFCYAIHEVNPDLVLVDYPWSDSILWETARVSPELPIVAIDDEGGEIAADLIVNGTVLDEYHQYSGQFEGTKVMAGGEYALIRPIFGQTPWTHSSLSSVAIVIGSGKRAHEWAFYLSSGAVNMTDWGVVHMIVGNTFSEIEKLSNKCSEVGIRLCRGYSGQEMAKVLSRVSTALITGGMVVYEAIAVGVPAVVYPQIRNLIPETQWFAARNCVIDLGYDNGMDPAKVESAVRDLLYDRGRAKAMSLVQRSTIDGLGMIRVAQAIDDLF